MDWSSILSAPLSIVGIIGIIAALQKAGIDIGGMLRSFLSVRDAESAHEATASLRNDFQKLLSQQEVLSEHFNHETTELLQKVVDKLGEMHDCLKLANRKLDEQDKYGVKVRKE